MIKSGVGGSNTLTGQTWEESQSDILLLQAEIKAGLHPHLKDVSKRTFVTWVNEHTNYADHCSMKLYPDVAIYNMSTKTLWVLELKYQRVNGSVDEKLQTCRFKKDMLSAVAKAIDPEIRVDYAYLLNDWFLNARYQSVLDFILTQGCDYFINDIPPNVWHRMLDNQS